MDKLFHKQLSKNSINITTFKLGLVFNVLDVSFFFHFNVGNVS